MRGKFSRKKMILLSFFILSMGMFGSDGGLGIASTFDKAIGLAQVIARYVFMFGVIGTGFIAATGKGPDGTVKWCLVFLVFALIVSNIVEIADLANMTSGVMY